MMPSWRWWVVVLPIVFVVGLAPMLVLWFYDAETLRDRLPHMTGSMGSYACELGPDDFTFRERQMLVRREGGDWQPEMLRVGRAVIHEDAATVVAEVVFEGPVYDTFEWPQTIATVKTGWPLRCFSGRSTDEWDLRLDEWKSDLFIERSMLWHHGAVRHTASLGDGVHTPEDWYWLQMQGFSVSVLALEDSSQLSGWWLNISTLGRVHTLPLVFNAFVWGSPLLALFLGVRFLKRANRRRRGLCTTCRYQLAGLTTCPECGTLSMAAGSP